MRTTCCLLSGCVRVRTAAVAHSARVRTGATPLYCFGANVDAVCCLVFVADNHMGGINGEQCTGDDTCDCECNDARGAMRRWDGGKMRVVNDAQLAGHRHMLSSLWDIACLCHGERGFFCHHIMNM